MCGERAQGQGESAGVVLVFTAWTLECRAHVREEKNRHWPSSSPLERGLQRF
jgi:hypothetical protein